MTLTQDELREHAERLREMLHRKEALLRDSPGASPVATAQVNALRERLREIDGMTGER